MLFSPIFYAALARAKDFVGVICYYAGIFLSDLRKNLLFSFYMLTF